MTPSRFPPMTWLIILAVFAQGVASFVIADMPFMSYPNPEKACENAAQLMRAGANMVKLEGGEWLHDSIKALTQQGIPVCGHLGLTPQSVHVFGGFKIQGRDSAQAQKMINDAKALEQAGAQLLVIEQFLCSRQTNY